MEKEPSGRAAWGVVVALIIGYIGIYLCRKNLSAAVPLLQEAFGASKEEIGRIASVSTVAYALGKLVNGAVVDRIGGRTGFLMALVAVALFGAAGAFAPGLAALTLFYSLNRYAGSAGWGSMIKLVPGWFRPAQLATVIGVLSLSYVFGGVAALLLAGLVKWLGGGWRAVMGVPSAVLLVVAVYCAVVVWPGPLRAEPAESKGRKRDSPAEAPDQGAAPPPVPGSTSEGVAEGGSAATGAEAAGSEDTVRRWDAVLALFLRPQFLLVCALSFTLTLMRESFNTWGVDFLTSIQHGARSVATAALQSTGFDLAGGISILAMGFLYDRARPGARRWLIVAVLALLTAVLAVLPGAGRANPVAGAWLVGAVGLLVYGPYSLLGGVFAVESGGAKLAATAAGIIDSIGYLAGILAGAALGRLLDVGGYSLGFGCLAVLTAVSAVLAMGLRLGPPAAR